MQISEAVDQEIAIGNNTERLRYYNNLRHGVIESHASIGMRGADHSGGG